MSARSSAVPTRELHLLLPGDPRTRTGGYLYDRRIVEGLRARGWAVTVHALDASFPHPGRAALDTADRTLAMLPEGSLAVIDGLALGAMPREASAHRDRLRLIGLVHHPLAEETGLEPARAVELAASERAALAATRRIIVTSHTTAAGLATYGVPREAVGVVEPGTDPAPLARGTADPARHGLALLSVGAITPRKGHEVLIEALARLRGAAWHLVCAGAIDRSPDTTSRLRARVAALGLDARVDLPGEIDESALASHYDRADVFVLASWHEGYGMALAEALARGLPVVSTRAGAIPSTVPADAGVLVPPGDVGALADALERVLTDSALRSRLRAGARAHRARLPTWDEASAHFEAELDIVAAPR
ncbi:MAG: glycosyltransferase family 4 protein [Ectothiorhodospiraceae bacterium]|nr:glycosyltransferase family 4 protein [Ectothiorhodospiraceae bacterium]